MKMINYQQIYEDEVSDPNRESLEWSPRFYELSHQQRMIIEQLIDAGYRRALEDALDPSLLEDTAALAGEMGTQLYNFANMLNTYVEQQKSDEDSI